MTRIGETRGSIPLYIEPEPKKTPENEKQGIIRNLLTSIAYGFHCVTYCCFGNKKVEELRENELPETAKKTTQQLLNLPEEEAEEADHVTGDELTTESLLRIVKQELVKKKRAEEKAQSVTNDKELEEQSDTDVRAPRTDSTKKLEDLLSEVEEEEKPPLLPIQSSLKDMPNPESVITKYKPKDITTLESGAARFEASTKILRKEVQIAEHFQIALEIGDVHSMKTKARKLLSSIKNFDMGPILEQLVHLELDAGGKDSVHYKTAKDIRDKFIELRIKKTNTPQYELFAESVQKLDDQQAQLKKDKKVDTISRRMSDEVIVASELKSFRGFKKLVKHAEGDDLPINNIWEKVVDNVKTSQGEDSDAYKFAKETQELAESLYNAYPKRDPYELFNQSLKATRTQDAAD